MAFSSALDYITIQGFKSIASIEKLPLRPLNVLIGANGSGKSNFIGAFAFLQAIREGRLTQYVTAAGGAEKVLHFGSKTTKEIVFHISFENEVLQYHLGLSPTSDDGLFPAAEWVDHTDTIQKRGPFRTPLIASQRGREAGISDPVNRDANSFRFRIQAWKVYHFLDTSLSSPMRKTARVDDNEFLRADGSNLAAFLYYLREKHYDSYDLIRRTVQQVAPFFEDFQLRPLNLNPDDIKLEWRHKKSDQDFDVSSLSDGTLRFIALATLFLHPTSNLGPIVLVDEPELGLHPYAIEMLASLMRQASLNKQLIVSTQSSLLLDHFEPEDVLVANRVDDGTQLERLDSAQLASWLKDYSLGQLWEKNELGGRPVPA